MGQLLKTRVTQSLLPQGRSNSINSEIMAFWQENYSFIKDVYDSRSGKLVELMDKTDIAIKDVMTDKLYTSEEFKKVKEIFTGLARNLEQPEIKDWLSSTKDLLMGEKSGKDQEKAAKELNETLERFDVMAVKVKDTKAAVDCLWKCYQYTDELTPLIEWLEESKMKSTKEIQSNSVAQTEEILERHEKNLNALDKKKKVYTDQKAKGDKLKTDPKCPPFLGGQLTKLQNAWKEANDFGDQRLDDLKKNLESWEGYENFRNKFDGQIQEAEVEFKDTVRIYNLEEGPKNHTARLATASKMRKQIEETMGKYQGANNELAKMLPDDTKDEMQEEVNMRVDQMKLLNDMDDKLKMIDEFNGHIVEFNNNVIELEQWLPTGRERMDELLNPDSPVTAEDRVVQTMELQSDVMIEVEKMEKLSETWSELSPNEAAENTSEASEFVKRMDTVKSTQGALLTEVQAQSAKFGDDVKYLAEFTAGIKKFDPWIQKADAKRAVGMLKPKNLQEALDQLEGAKTWLEEAGEMNKILEHSNAEAQKMTAHKDADLKYAAYKARWVVIEATAKEWIGKYEKMVEVWQKQADTANKVTAAIGAKPDEGGDAAPMKLEDLEGHLNALKEMFIQKQKMMEELEKTAEAPSAGPPPATPAPTPEAPAAAT